MLRITLFFELDPRLKLFSTLPPFSPHCLPSKKANFRLHPQVPNASQWERNGATWFQCFENHIGLTSSTIKWTHLWFDSHFWTIYISNWWRVAWTGGWTVEFCEPAGYVGTRWVSHIWLGHILNSVQNKHEWGRLNKLSCHSYGWWAVLNCKPISQHFQFKDLISFLLFLM